MKSITFLNFWQVNKNFVYRFIHLTGEIRPTARPSFQLWRPSEPAGGYQTLSPDWFALCHPTEAKPFIKDTVREAKKGKMVVGYSVGYGFEKLSLEDKISTEWKQISQC